jgi:hypothetical protein
MGLWAGGSSSSRPSAVAVGAEELEPARPSSVAGAGELGPAPVALGAGEREALGAGERARVALGAGELASAPVAL